MSRPIGVSLLALLCILFAVSALMLSVFFFQYAQQEGMVALYWGFGSMNAFYLLSVGSLLFGGCCAADAYALWNLEPWARRLTAIMLVTTSIVVEADGIAEFESPIPLLLFVSLLALNSLVLGYLSMTRVKQAFGQA
jgi:hypothetical protein